MTETATVHAAAWKRLFDEYLEERARTSAEAFLAFDEHADYDAYVDGRSRYDGVRTFLASRGVSLPEGSPGDPPDAATVCGLGNRKDGYFRALIQEDGVRVFASTVRLIEGLRHKGVRVGLVTSSRNADELLAAAGVRQLFDEKVDGVDAAARGLAGKPDPATFLEAAARLGVAPGRAAVVEDAVSGVEAGRRGGFGVVIGVARAGQAASLRKAGADLVVSDLAEVALPGA